MLLKDFISESTSSLTGLYPESEAHSIIMMLCTDLLGVKSYTHIIEPSFAVPESRTAELEEAVARLVKAEPVQYVLGHTLFHDLDFHVTPAVLIPRPETEEIVSEAVREAERISRMRQSSAESKPVRVLDLCTGSGCIAWTMALSVPGCEVVAVDLSEEALKVAQGQDFKRLLAERHAKAPLFVKADVLDTEAPFEHGVFDIVISNPPYVMDSQKADMRPNVLGYEPHMALFVSDDDPLVFYRAVASWALRHMEANGRGFVEINDLLGPQTERIFREAGFPHCSQVADFSGKRRCVTFSKRP